MVELKMFQGESREVKDNVPLGSLRVPLPRLPRERQDVEVRFTYDINGLLEVEATVLATQARQRLVIEQTPGAMSAEDIDKSLAALARLKIHPREQAENHALVERLARLYEQNLGERREWVARHLSAFEALLERQDPRDIAHVRAELTRLLDQFEGTPVL
jgi:molecular chaperone HscC